MEKVILMTQGEFEELKSRFNNKSIDLEKQLESSQKENKSLLEQRSYLLKKISKLEKKLEELMK